MGNPSSLASSALSEKARLLVVDDQQEVGLALKEYFQNMGYSINCAESGMQALQKMVEQVFDVIVLDLLMPEMDGIEFCARLKSDPVHADTGVLMLTAVTNEASRLKALQAGADDYVTKPFSFQELELRIRLQARATAERRAIKTALANAQSKNNILEVVAEMAQQITSLSGDDLSQLCHRTVSAVVDRFGYEIVTVFILDHASDEAMLYASAGVFSDTARLWTRIPIEKGIVGYVCRTKEAYHTGDVWSDPHWTTNPLELEAWKRIHSGLCVPIKVEDKVWGCILIESVQPDAFDASDQLMLATLARYMVVAITNTRLYREMIDQTTELGVHTEILEALNGTRDLQPLFETIHHHIHRIVPHTDMYVTRYDAASGFFTLLYLTRPDEMLQAGIQMESRDLPLLTKAGQRGVPIIIGDVLALERLAPGLIGHVHHTGARSGIIVPVPYHEQGTALLILTTDQVDVFTQKDADRLHHLAPHLALAIKQAEEYRALQKAYADLQQAQDSALQAEREKAALDTTLQAGLTLSHEINNPLTAIIGFAELLTREHPDNAEYKIILQAGQRIADVVRRLRHLKSVRLKAYVPDIPIQMIDLGLTEPGLSSEAADQVKATR